MLVTEEEAKIKRCQESFPAASGLSPEGASYPSGWHYPPPPAASGSVGIAVHTAPTHCIGSGCMAWHWNEPQPYEYGRDLAKGHVPADPGWEAYESYTAIEGNGIVTYEKWRRPKPGRLGYCGKAHHPAPACTCP